MADDTKKADKPVAKPVAKPAAATVAKKPAAKAAVSYVVAEGKALSIQSRIAVAGEAVTAAEVADIEALVKGGYVVKA